MRKYLTPWIGLALMASACQLTAVVGQTPHKGASARPADAEASPPTTPAGTAASAAPTVPPFAKLQRPTGDGTTVLAGTVNIDAAYAVAAGSNLVANNASSVLAAGGGHLVSNNAGTIISDKGSGVIASGDGNVIANNAAGVISEHGAGVISEHGAGVISEHGAGLTGKTKLRVLADAAASGAADVAVGTVLPAAGMQIKVVSMADGSPVSLGVDPDGKAVYAIYTNAGGKYEVYVPKALEHNVLVQATVPQTADPRLSYGLIAAAQAASDLAIDEDTSLVAKFLRTAFQGKLRQVMSAPNFDDPDFLANTFPAIKSFPVYAAVIKNAATQLRARFQQDHVTPDRAPAVAGAAADACIAFVNLADVKVSADGTDWKGPADEAALPVMVSILNKARLGAQARMREQGADYFNQQPFVQEANRNLASGMPAFQIVKPTDLADFGVNAYLTSTDPNVFNKIWDVFKSVDVPATEVQHLFAANNGFALMIGLTFAQNPDATQAVFQAIDKAAAAP